MTKPIWVALDTEDIESWIDNCPDWLEDSLLDDDEDELDNDTFDKAKEWVVDHATNGQLANDLSAILYDTWLGEQFNDMVWDVVMDFVRTEAEAFKTAASKED